ncbi:uncharacterized [Tachysurus ichikawai]
MINDGVMTSPLKHPSPPPTPLLYGFGPEQLQKLSPLGYMVLNQHIAPRQETPLKHVHTRFPLQGSATWTRVQTELGYKSRSKPELEPDTGDILL